MCFATEMRAIQSQGVYVPIWHVPWESGLSQNHFGKFRYQYMGVGERVQWHALSGGQEWWIHMSTDRHMLLLVVAACWWVCVSNWHASLLFVCQYTCPSDTHCCNLVVDGYTCLIDMHLHCLTAGMHVYTTHVCRHTIQYWFVLVSAVIMHAQSGMHFPCKYFIR